LLNVLYCAFEEGLLEIEKNIPIPNPNVRYFISLQGDIEKIPAIPISLQSRSDLEISILEGRGLSKNRNNAIKMALESSSSQDIFLIADEDVEFIEGFETVIITAFNQNIDTHILTFQISTGLSNQKYKSYWEKERKIRITEIDTVSSIEMAGRADVFKRVKFEENLGLGSTFPSGEETAFLADSLRAGFQIKYIPKPIVIHPLESSGKNRKDLFTENALNLIGGRVYRIYGEPMASLFYVFSTIKNFQKYRSQISPLRYYQALQDGKKQYKNLVNG
jgi:GT2 family glycosyltransferase